MAAAFYGAMFVVSLILTGIYVFMWHKHFDVMLTLIFTLVTIGNLTYFLMATAADAEAAILARKLSYIGGCYLTMFVFLVVCSLCKINVGRWLRVLLFSISTVVFLSSQTMGTGWGIFYKTVEVKFIDGEIVFERTFGFMHTVFYVMLLSYFLMSVAVTVYSYFKKKQISRNTIYMLFATEVIGLMSYFGARILGFKIEMIALGYNLALILYLIITSRMCLYDITDTAIDSMVRQGETAIISFDLKLNYLGANDPAKAFFPELSELTVDKPITGNELTRENALVWLSAFREDETKNTAKYERDDRIYFVQVSYLYDGQRKRGYHLFVNDDTENQKYITLLNSFNTELSDKVAEQTEHMIEMHDNLILGLATMVESRDNSTGGHIRRTSEGVRLLVEEMMKGSEFGLSPEFCRNIIKAAPMHDLGKIAVDDAVLKKPGRYTPEEFEEMKSHAAEGARIVGEILEKTDDAEFRRIAENVAHYHHERMDGSGYPEGLKGDEIPLEARIMAIADVYDALVSKRVYKESMSFEQADSIIMQEMGPHFDKKLEKYYVRTRPKLEAYYAQIAKEAV